MLCLAEVATHTRHIEEQAHVDAETLQGKGGGLLLVESLGMGGTRRLASKILTNRESRMSKEKETIYTETLKEITNTNNREINKLIDGRNYEIIETKF